MNLGYSHPVEMDPPAGITFDVADSNHITVRGIDKELVGQTAAVVRTKRPPEVYRGKGISMLRSVLDVKRVKPARSKGLNEKLRLAVSTITNNFSIYKSYYSKLFAWSPSNTRF